MKRREFVSLLVGAAATLEPRLWAREITTCLTIPPAAPKS